MAVREREHLRYRVVGQPIPRHDAWDKALGRTAYASDWSMPGMLIGKVLRSPYPSARIRRIDTSRARALPGVAAVLTARDVPRNTLWTDVPGQTTEVGPLRAKLCVLAEDWVRYQGEPVALVAAETEELAEEALRLIQVDYEPTPGVFDPLEALAPGAPLVHPDGGSNLLYKRLLEPGTRYRFVVPPRPQFVAVIPISLVRGRPNGMNGELLMNYLLREDIQWLLAKELGVVPGNSRAKMPERLREFVPRLDQVYQVDWSVVNANFASWLERWAREVGR